MKKTYTYQVNAPKGKADYKGCPVNGCGMYDSVS